MLSKNNKLMNQKKSGRKFEKYSIKKLKVGAASVLVGAGFFLGFHVEASEVKEPATNEVVSSSTQDPKEKVSEAPKVVAEIEQKTNQAAPSVDNQLVEEKNTNVATEKATSVEEKNSTIVEKAEQPTDEKKATVETSKLVDKMTALQEQVDRVRSNEKQKSLVEKAEKLLEEAKALQKSSSATQPEVDAKTKEISSLTSILKSIKAEETPKENKNQDSRNGKKMEEGTGFRTGGVTDQALTGSIHFDTSKGPTEKQIPVANNGDGERVINMAITYSASSDETVTDGKIRVTIPKAFLHSTKKPEFTNSSFVKSTDDRSTATDYVYDLNLNPMAGGSVAESLLKLYVGTSIKNAPSKGDSLPVKTEFISGGNVLSTKTATATFDYLSEIIYREKDTREKLVKNYLSQDQREYKLGSVVNGKLTPVKTPFRIPLIMTNEPFFNSGEADGWNQNGNGRLTSYDYTISGIPEFLELDPNAPNNSKWTLENGVATLHPDQTRGINQILVYAGPVLRLKEGALSTPEAIAKVIESNGTKGYNAKIVYKAVGHRPDGTSFTQTLENPDGFRIYAGDGAPSIGNMDDYINTQSNQRLFSNASNVDTFGATYTVPYHKLKADGGTLPSQYLSYLIPKDQEGNYFTRFKMYQVATNELENGNVGVKGYHAGYKDLRGQFKENFKLYGVNENNQAELIKEYMNIDELFSEITINPDKRYNHLILKTPGIVDELQDRNQPSKTIIGLTTNLDVTVGTWKEKAKDPNIQRYEDKISQVLAAENTLESAVATQRPNTGASNPAVHTKEATTLRLSMDQIGKRDLSKDNLTRGKNIPITVSYEAPDYFYLAESDKNGIKTYDLQKLDPNINKTSVMLLADPKLPLKDFRLTADNRLLSSTSIYYGGVNSEDGNWAYNRIKENYDTVNPTRIIENYKGTGKRAYIFESKDLGLSSFDLNRDGWIKGGTYKPAALTFEVENNGQIESGTYNIESYLVWNSDAETLFGNDRSLNADYVKGHEPGRTIAKANINVTMNNVIEYSTSLTISKPGTTGTRGIIDVKNGQQVILTPQIENLTDTPQKIKEAVVLIPKSEAVTYLEGPIAENSDEYDIEYTTSTAADKTQGTYVTADQITNWKDVTAVKYKFKKDYTVTKQHGFTHNFNLRVDPENQNFVQSTSQIFLKNNQNVWLESNIVGLRTEDVRGKLEVRYINNRKDDILPKISKRDFAGQPYTTTKEDIIPRVHWSGLPYLFKEIQADSAPETGTYEKQVTKKVTYVYEEATFKEESKTITRTINYLEKNNESNVVANPVVQNITVTRKVYTGKETGRVVEGPWEYSTDAYQPNWPRTNSPRVANFEAPDRDVIDRVLVSEDVINNGNVVENVYYERIMPIGGDVVAKYVIEGTTTELKQATDVAKGLKVGKSYTSTAPVAGEELTATDGKVYVYKGHKDTSAAETGTVTADKQEVVYEYAPKLGGNVEVKYVIAGTEENLKDPVALVTNGQIGSDYTATKDATITKEDGRVYKLVAANNGLKTGSAGETGKVTTEKQTVTYEYELQKGDVTVNYTDTEGNAIEGKPSVKAETQSPTGKEYNTNTPDLKPTTITTQSGKVYKLVPEQTVGKENGKVTVEPTEVTYKYELQKGDVTVNYRDTEGNEIEGKPSVKAENQSATGTDYNTNTPELKPTTITTQSGKVYKLVPEQTVGKENGKVTVEPTEVTYKYELQKGDVTVNYRDTEGNEIEGKPSVKAENQSATGTDYNTNTPELKPTTITTTSGKVYKLVPEQTVGKENGKVTVEPTEVTYKYELQKGDVTVNYRDTEGNEIEGKPSVKAENQSATGTDYNTNTPELKPTTITTTSGKVYKLVPEQTVGKENGKVTVEPTEVTYKYELQKGDVTVNYRDTEGNEIEGKPSVKVENQSATGTDYNTNTPELKPTTITTTSGKVYKLVPEQTVGKENGKVTVEPTEVTYKYELQKGDVTVNYRDTEGNEIEGKPSVKVENQSATGTDYNTNTPELKPTTITTTSGKVYKLVPEQTVGKENGKVTVEPTEVTYKYELQKGDVTVNYRDTEGNEIEGKPSVKAENQSATGTDYNTNTPELKPTTITTTSGKVYKLVPEQTVGKENGKVTVEPTEVTYKYELQKGDVTVNYRDTEGNEIEGKPSVKVENQSATGTDYNTNTPELKPTTITTTSGKVYKLVPEQTVGKENGKVTVEPTEVTYKYELQKGDVTVNYRDTEGNEIEGKPSVKVENQSATGTDYNTNTPELKPTTITTTSGKVYKLVPEQTVGKENGKVTVEPTEVTYKYELQKGDVTVNYRDTEGNEIEGKPSVKAENQSATGTDYNTNTPELKPTTITTTSGKVYKLVPEQTVGKENGKVTVEPTEVTYKYELQKGDVTVNYRDTEGNEIEGKPSVKAENQSATGTDYNTNTPELKPTTITTQSGKVYKLVPEQTVGKENGKVTVEPTEVTYKYELQKGDVTVNYRDTEGNEIEGKPSVKAENQSATGTDYNTNTPELKPTTITTTSGKVYKLVPEQTVGKENGKVTVEPTEVTYKYELQKGDVTVNYRDTEGNEIEGKPSVKAENQSATGTDYNTNTPELKPTTITTTSGKVYKLVPEQTVGKENGKVTVEPTEVTYKYELQKGDVTVNYRDTEGNEIEGKPSVKVENQSATGTDYNTNTPELKPTTITTTSGKVYKLVPEQTVGKENGKVTVEPTEVTYKYELQKGDVTVNYRDTEGNEIEGKPSVKVENQSATGTDYNTNTPELKPTTITTTSGKVYKLVPEQTVGKENGKVTVEPTEVTYKYELQKGDVTVNYRDTEGNEIEGKPSVKAENQSATGTDYNTNTPELKPTTITTTSGKVYKLVPEQTVGKENGKVTVEPTEVTYKYELQKGDVTVNYRDTEGNEIEGKPSVKAENQSATGTDYNTNTPELKPTTITTQSGKVYKLVPEQTVGKENGKVTVEPTEVTYKYELQKGDVTVNYRDTEGNEIEGKPSVKAENQSATGTDYNTNTPELKPTTITTQSGKVYKLVPEQTVGKENGKVTVEPTEVTYKYELQKGDVTVNYRDTEGNEIEGKPSVKAENQSATGTDYNTNTPELKPTTITTQSGKVYKLVPEQTVGKENGKVTVEPTEVTYKYELQKGDVTVNYRDTEGNEIEGKPSVKVENQSATGTDYNTNTPELKPTTITTTSGKVYKLVPEQTVGKENGKVTVEPTEVTYKYELQKGDVTVNYRDTEGNEIEGKPSVKVENQSATGTDYNTNTPELKPETITTANGDVYEFVKKSETSASETGKVNEGVTTVEYVYRKVVTTYVDETGKEINPSDKGTKDKKDIPEYIYKETKKDEKGNTIHVYRQVVTSYVDEEGKEINPSDKGTKDKKDIPEYIYKETKKDEKGNTTHVYRQVVTSYVDEEGKEINPSDKGTKDKKDIPEYIYKETKKDEKGNTTHVYRQVVTSYVDEEGKEINPSDKGTKDKKDIPEYIYKETKKDEKGNTTHVYRQVVTSYVDEEGKEINPSDKGTKDKKEISGYTFKQTKKDKDGNTIHVYTKKSSSTPETPKPTPETPNTDESKSTIWKSVDGETLKPRENGTKDKSSIPGYEFVRTEKDKEGNTVHIYRKVTSSTPEVKEKETSYVDENGKEIRSTKKGKQPKENIPGYEFVRTEEDSNGNVRHVYRQVVHSESKVETPTTVQEHKNELPNTGTGDEFTIFGAAAASILAGLGIAIPGKKKED